MQEINERTINNNFLVVKETKIEIPALSHPTIQELKEHFSGIDSICSDVSPVGPVRLGLATILDLNSDEKFIGVNGHKFGSRIYPHRERTLGFQHAIWLAENKEFLLREIGDLGSVLIFFPGLYINSDLDPYRGLPSLSGDKDGIVSWENFIHGFSEYSYIACCL